jgi:repressor LexA
MLYYPCTMKSTNVLTKKQAAVYQFIKSSISATGEAPTLKEIAGKLGVSSIRTVTQHLEALERKGLIARSRYAQRGIILTENRGFSSDEMVQVPVFASAGCGNPSIIAQRTFDECVMVPPDMVGDDPSEVFLIRATGRSMEDGGISDGDFVMVRRTEDVQTGDRIVAIVDDSAVIKRLSFANDAVILSPESKDPRFHPIILKRNNFSVFGKVVRVLKIQRSEEHQYILDKDQGNA